MFTSRSAFTLVLGALAGFAGVGCGPVFKASLQVQVVTADLQPQIGVANATLTFKQADKIVATQTTNPLGATTISPSQASLTQGVYTLSVSAPGYTTYETLITVGATNNVSLTGMNPIRLHLNAPALVFKTFSGSTANPVPQPASVTVAAQPPFTGATVQTSSQYATVIVPNLQPSTNYPYIVSSTSQGFQPVMATVMTGSGNTFTPVNVLLSPPTPLTVEFDTSFASLNGDFVASQATVTLSDSAGDTLPSITPSTLVTQPPVSYYSGTLELLPGTYSYSASFPQFNGATVTGRFTVPTSSATNVVVSIVYNPAATNTLNLP